ncbi:MAG: hypothetical protein A3G44_08380 [Candidatus Rokubacteria bacterium RIFCSPLOWO2_12_FULL_73_47]|nr:MAG: hypothetical protein A3G44_08380 [Candidatus Rokubacteria bacterium RIFCSPLOWO2_12_FULL_73_47]
MVHMVQKNLTVAIPERDGKFPVVIFYQGTGGGNRRAEKWASWFKTLGVASAIVDNAGIRNRTTNPARSMYTEDAAIAWDLLKTHPRIDTSRFALMGFSRGGQQALEAGPHFTGERAAPTFVFALYPGGWGPDRCRSTYGRPTQVHIFFGDLDDVGRDEGYSHACSGLARGRDPVEFHELKGATHGYDDVFSYTFTYGRARIARVEPNPDAVERTKSIIAKAIRARWDLWHEGQGAHRVVACGASPSS